MALIDCKECHQPVSDTAQLCPHCGAPVRISIAHAVDPKAAMTFRNPATQETLDIAHCWAWALLFGVFYFLYRRVWAHALISAIAAMVTYGVAWLIYPFFAREVMRKHLVAQGWIAVQ